MISLNRDPVDRESSRKPKWDDLVCGMKGCCCIILKSAAGIETKGFGADHQTPFRCAGPWRGYTKTHAQPILFLVPTLTK